MSATPRSSNGSSSGMSAGLRTPPPGIRSVANGNVFDNNLSPTRSSSKAKGGVSDISSQTQCRNIVIYGFCRYQDRGCIFNHDKTVPKAASPGLAGLGSPISSNTTSNNNTNTEMQKRKLNVESAAFTPGASPSFSHAVISSPPQTKLSFKAVNAEVFTPRMGNMGAATPPISTTPLPQTNIMESMYSNGYMPADTSTYPSLAQGFDRINLDNSGSNPFEYTPAIAAQPVNPYAHQTTGGDAYYAQSFAQPLQYHLYAPIGAHKSNLLPYQRTVHDLFINDGLREELQRKAEASLQTLPNSTLPPNVDNYHSLVPLDLHLPKANGKGALMQPQSILGYTSWVYKAFSSKDGNPYILRRLEGFRMTNEKAIRIVEQWKKVLNANIVTVHDAFTTRAFGDASIVFVFDYHPLAQTLQETHFGANSRFQPRHGHGHNSNQFTVTEQLVWSYTVQITSALKTIHSSGLAARMVDATKILLTSKNRVRLNCCSIFDVLNFDVQRSIPDLQQDDYVALGKLLLAIACNNAHAMLNTPKSMEYVSRSFSPDVKNLLMYLLYGQTGKSRTMEELLNMISPYLIQSFDSSLHCNDSMESSLLREVENARLFRLLCKFGFINERPEFEHDRAWAETGDRYLISLFRDYVFHQVDDQGLPVVDLVHVLTCLNKLDAGIEEKLMLISRDEQNCIIVTYKELKRVIDSSFQELLKGR